MKVNMVKKSRSGLLLVPLLVIAAAWAAVIPRVSALDLTAPTQVVNEYLSSLVN